MRYIWMITFLLLPLAGLAYVLWHLWQLMPFGHVWRTVVVVLCFLTVLMMFLSLSGVIDRMPMGLATAVYETGYSALFVLLYAVMLFLVLDLGRAVRLVPAAWLHGNVRTLVAIVLLMGGIFTYGYLHYRAKVRQPLDLVTDKPLVRPLRIVMLSDLHLGYHNRRAELRRWVGMINAEHPDLILIGGDIVDMSVRPLLVEDDAAELRRLSAPVYACLGNHEYISGDAASARFYREAGITLLRDSVADVMGVRIVGRDDRSNPHRRNLSALLRDHARSAGPSSPYTIVLDHQPYRLDQAERAGADFQFSGHTHHGQVWPVSWITDALYEKAFGPLRKGRTQYYVSSGMGIWGGKFRIGTRSEYVVATLRPAR